MKNWKSLLVLFVPVIIIIVVIVYNAVEFGTQANIGF